MSHKNPIADELCRSFVNENGRKVGGNAALLKNIKDAGGIKKNIAKLTAR